MPDGRSGPKSLPNNALSKAERQEMLRLANAPEYSDLTPHLIVAKLADKGQYIASERSFYRVLKAHKQLAHRSKSKPRVPRPKKSHIAKSPNKVWSWDITYMLTSLKGKYYYLYLVEDIFSRMIVGFRVEESESSELASGLIEKICKEHGIRKNQIHLHSDNGAPMKGATMLATLQRLGVIPSFSRPSVSDDNAYSESLFKTLKYCAKYPSKPFTSLNEARVWVEDFTLWYNTEHLHSEIKYVTPYARHYGLEKKNPQKPQKYIQQCKTEKS